MAHVRHKIARPGAVVELGLQQRNEEGIRLLPDGRRMEVVVETSGEDNEQSDVLELLADQWSAIGFKISAKPSDRQIMRSRVYSGDALMSMFFERPPCMELSTSQTALSFTYEYVNI